MFGPDKCGEDYKLHFIFRHKHPKTGVFEEKHAKPPDVDLKKFFTDRKTHLYTLGISFSFIHSFFQKYLLTTYIFMAGALGEANMDPTLKELIFLGK